MADIKERKIIKPEKPKTPREIELDKALEKANAEITRLTDLLRLRETDLRARLRDCENLIKENNRLKKLTGN